MWHMHEVGWGWWLLMSLGMVAFWGLVIFGILTLLRVGGTRSEPEQARDISSLPALDILKRRLATGEISVEEYERRRRIVVEDGPRTPTAA